MAMKLTESEKKLDNTLRSINKHLNDVFKTFGGNSYEYEKAQSVVKSKLTGSVFKMPEYNDSGEMIKPMQIGRSRTALNALKSQTNEVNEVRQFEKDVEKSAKVQAQKYIQKLKSEGVKATAQRIRDFATSIKHNSFNDIYKDIMNNPNIPDAEKNIFLQKTRNIHTDGLEQAEQYGQELLVKYNTVYFESLGDEPDEEPFAESFDINQLS
jgi:hypothetical protein